MGRQHCQALSGDRELGPKAVEHPVGILQGACSILSSPALLSSMQRLHPTLLPLHSPLHPFSQSFPLPCVDSTGLELAELLRFSAGTASGSSLP